MKVVTALCLFVLAAVAVAAPAEDTYEDKYDEAAVQEILSNRRLLLPYIKCALDQGKCSAEGKEMKERLQDALATECAKCSESQKATSANIFKHLIVNEKEYWDQLVDKYDPEKKYAPLFEKEYLPQ